MNPKVAASFTIVLTLAMMLSANPAMIMSSNIFASEDDGGRSDGGSSDGGSSEGSNGSSENEQSEEESESAVQEEETVPETKSVLVNCPDGTQAATTEECGTGTGTTPPQEFPNVLWGHYFYADPCQSNPADPACKSSITSSTTTPEAPFGSTTGAPSGSLPTEAGSEKSAICTTSPNAPFCKSQTIIGTIDDTPAETLLLPYFEIDLDKGETIPFTVNNPVCQSNPADPACKSSTTTGTSTGSTTPIEGEVPKKSDGTCPPGSSEVGFGGKTGSNALPVPSVFLTTHLAKHQQCQNK